MGLSRKIGGFLMAGASFFEDRFLYYTINLGDAHGSFSVKKNHSAASIGGKSASVRRGSTHNYAKSPQSAGHGRKLSVQKDDFAPNGRSLRSIL